MQTSKATASIHSGQRPSSNRLPSKAPLRTAPLRMPVRVGALQEMTGATDDAGARRTDELRAVQHHAPRSPPASSALREQLLKLLARDSPLSALAPQGQQAIRDLLERAMVRQ